MNEKIEGMVAYGMKFTYFIVECQGQIRQEPPFAVVKYPAEIGEIKQSLVLEDMVKIVVLKDSIKAIGICDEA